MMIEPPIDELTVKMGGNKYKLCCVMEKRAKELELEFDTKPFLIFICFFSIDR